MKSRIFCLIVLGTMVMSAGFCQDNIVAFYPHVDSLIQFPPMKDSLDLMGQKKVGGLFVALYTVKGYEKTWLAVVTPKREREIKKKITLSVDFDGPRPSAGEITTWAYIFDRNSDGRIDYMALLGGAAPVKRDDFPADFPFRGKPPTRAQLELIVSHSSLLFNHWADENFDDTLDAVIHIDMDPLRDWLQRHLVVRSSRFGGRFDEVWGFQWRIDSDRDSVDHTAKDIPYNPVGKTEQEHITPKNFTEKTAVLGIINQAFAMCQRTTK